MKTTTRTRTTKAAREAAKQAREVQQAEALRIVQGGKCPYCGSGLHANSAILGWYQCDRFGADGFRKDPAGPACSFQVFIEF